MISLEMMTVLNPLPEEFNKMINSKSLIFPSLVESLHFSAHAFGTPWRSLALLTSAWAYPGCFQVISVVGCVSLEPYLS